MRLDDLPTSLVYAFAAVLGMFGGSFLNVVIYRVPRGMSIVQPPSHCPGCGAKVKAYDNVPVLSYAVLGGRARCCKVRISPHYPLVEILGGALAFAIARRLVMGLPSSTSAGRALAMFGADLAFSLALVAIAFIDMEHM